MADIARVVGVSKSAVSIALRNDPRIPEARRKEIQNVAEQMGYRPNSMAAGLAHFRHNSKSHPVQASLAWLNLWKKPEGLRRLREFDAYWCGAFACAEKFGYRLEEFVVNDKLSVSRLQTVLLARGVDGILIPPHQEQPDWGTFAWEKFSSCGLVDPSNSPLCMSLRRIRWETAFSPSTPSVRAVTSASGMWGADGHTHGLFSSRLALARRRSISKQIGVSPF